MSIAISSGHGLFSRGAAGIIDEVNEARSVVNQVSSFLKAVGVQVNTFHDNTTPSSQSTVNNIVSWHNKQSRNLDVSIHFNDHGDISANGTETLFKSGNTQMQNLAERLSSRINQASGLRLRGTRGAVSRIDLGFLNNTNINRAILVEVCFVKNQNDVTLYHRNFMNICVAIAEVISGVTIPSELIPLPM
jgi:N-acetylmuramoyl-L-alanine amidase